MAGGPRTGGAGVGPVAAYRRYWLPELALLFAAAVAATVLFAVTGMDIATLRPFYQPALSNPWPAASRPFWRLLYRSAPWVTGSLAAAGTGLLLAGSLRPGRERLRLHGLFLLLCVAVGPGLVINGILKDHWGRPRPRQIREFGGSLEYRPAPLPSRSHGKSFPCGHCSVGYLYGAGWWVWRRRRPRLAEASLAAGLVFGTLLGIGRMAAGGHFLSDAVWSALIAFGTAHLLYYHVLRIPAREDRLGPVYPALASSRRARTAAAVGGILLGAGIIGGGILASPTDRDLSARVRLAEYAPAPERVEVLAGTLDVEIRLVREPRGEIECAGHLYGFGLPTNEIRAGWKFDPGPLPTLRYRVEERGVFTDLDGTVRIRIPAGGIRRISVKVRRGDIRVLDDRGADARLGDLPVMDLHTGQGRVSGPARPAP